MSLTRIPLDVVVTATGERTGGKLVAVMADDFDRLENERDTLWDAAGDLLDVLRDELRQEVACTPQVLSHVEAMARLLGGPFKPYTDGWE